MSSAVRYVGKTQVPDSRLSAHLSKAKSGETSHHCAHWIRQLLADGLRPVFNVVFEVPDDELWQDHEKRLIAEYRDAGACLTNLTGGGGGFYQADPELLRRRGRTRSAQFQISAVKEAFRKSVTLSHAKPEVKRAHSDGAKNAWSDPDKRAMFISSMNTPEALARRAAASKRRYENPEFRAKHSDRQKNDPVRKEQLRQASLKRWADYRARKASNK